MGCDIQLFCEGFLSSGRQKEKKWINIDRWYRQNGWAEYMATENEGFDYTDLVNGVRDYRLFYLLAGIRGKDEKNSYLPIAKAKGLPQQMDTLLKKYYEDLYEIRPKLEEEDFDVHHASYLSLKELKESCYGYLMPLRGWVYEDEFNKAVSLVNSGEKYQLNFVDIKCNDMVRDDMVLREWEGYINLNLTYMIERMEKLKAERKIDSDDDIRIIFWFNN